MELLQPDDFHHHLRDDAILKDTVHHAEQTFGRIVVMPNLRNPVVNSQMASEYRNRILSHSSSLCPLMTIYLTDMTSPETIEAAHLGGVVAAKLYPRGATTNAENGVSDINKLGHVFQVNIVSELLAS